MRRGGLVLNKTGAVFAALALAGAASAGEPGGFRAGLYLGETAAACGLSIPVAVGGYYLAAVSTSLYDESD